MDVLGPKLLAEWKLGLICGRGKTRESKMADEDEEEALEVISRNDLLQRLCCSQDKLSEIIEALSNESFGEKATKTYMSLISAVEARVCELHEEVLEPEPFVVVECANYGDDTESAEFFEPLPSPTDVMYSFFKY